MNAELTSTAIKAKLQDFIVTEILRNPAFPLTDDTPLLKDGLIQSLAMVNIYMFIETTFGIEAPVESMSTENVETIEGLAAFVQAQMAL